MKTDKSTKYYIACPVGEHFFEIFTAKSKPDKKDTGGRYDHVFGPYNTRAVAENVAECHYYHFKKLPIFLDRRVVKPF